MKIYESTLEYIMFDCLQTPAGTQKLKDRGLEINYDRTSKIYRQLDMKEYGRPDIVRISFKPHGLTITIIELKVTDFNISHILQLGRYASGAASLVEGMGFEKHGYKRKARIDCILIGGDFDHNNDYVWLDRLVSERVSVYSTEFSIDGIQFTRRISDVGWHRKTEPNVSAMVDMKEMKRLYQDSYRESLQELDW